jgi:serine/threonine protein kinase/WD40 repeat protein
MQKTRGVEDEMVVDGWSGPRIIAVAAPHSKQEAIMPVVCTCPQGHRWEVSPGGAVEAAPASSSCPTCGAPATVEPSTLTLAVHGTDPGRTLPFPPPGGPREPLPLLPGYEVIEELGRGGMGVVYKARHLALKRIVALKMIRAGAAADAAYLTRFRIEAEAVARLAHPNIVQIHEVGQAGGQPYFSLEYVSGGSLDRQVRGNPQPPRDAAALVERLARAVDYAHVHGVIHRDLKPANVLVNEDGQPKITDFGLAKQLDEEARQTVAGQVLGTPSYMAPEQAEGRVNDVSPRTDVWALGAMLYECLTGRPPFQGGTPLITLEMVRTQDPVPPSRLQPTVPRDLETICLKCLEKDQRRRYASALALADDLRRLQEGRPILARPAGPGERLLKWARRNPISTGLSLALVVVALVAFIVVLIQLGLTKDALGKEQEAKKEADTQKDAAVKARAEAQADRDSEQKTGYFRTVALGLREWEDGHLSQAKARLTQCPPALRGWEYHLLDRLCNKELASVRPHRSPFNFLAVSPDGTLIAAANWDYAVLVWDARTGEVLHHLLGHRNSVNGLAFSPDGTRLASVGAGRSDAAGEVRAWDVRRGLHLFVQDISGEPTDAVAYSPDGKLLAVATRRRVFLWDTVQKKSLPQPLEDAGADVLACDPTGRRLLLGLGPRLHLWDRQTSELVRYRGHTDRISAVAFHPDGQRFASASYDRTVKLWHRELSRPFLQVPGVIGPFTVSADGRRLAVAVGNTRTRIELWDLETGEQLGTLQEHREAIAGLAFRANRGLVSASVGRPVAGGRRREERAFEVKVWNLDAQEELAGFECAGMFRGFTPDGGRVIVAGKDGALQLRDAAGDGEAIALAPAAAQLSGAVLSSPDGTRAAILREFEVEIMGLGQHVPAVRLQEHLSPVASVAWSADGRRLVTATRGFTPFDVSGGRPGELKLWDAETGKLLRRFVGHDAGINAVALSPDGRRLASTGQDGTLRLWEVESGLEILALRVIATRVQFDPQGRRLLVGTNAGVQVWDGSPRGSEAP